MNLLPGMLSRFFKRHYMHSDINSWKFRPIYEPSLCGSLRKSITLMCNSRKSSFLSPLTISTLTLSAKSRFSWDLTAMFCRNASPLLSTVSFLHYPVPSDKADIYLDNETYCLSYPLKIFPHVVESMSAFTYDLICAPRKYIIIASMNILFPDAKYVCHMRY